MTSQPEHPKAPQLPPNRRIQKRPLLHPPIPAPKATSQPKIIYISSNTPFVSAVKRVQTFLGSSPKSSCYIREGEEQDVVLKATGKAIDKALQIGLYFLETENECVVFRTGSVDVIDDIVPTVEVGDVEEEEGRVKEVTKKRGGGRGGRNRKRKRGEDGSGVVAGINEQEPGEVEMGDNGEDSMKVGDYAEVSMKTRKTSMIEIIISPTKAEPAL